jgi:hypothetical protein
MPLALKAVGIDGKQHDKKRDEGKSIFFRIGKVEAKRKREIVFFGQHVLILPVRDGRVL